MEEEGGKKSSSISSVGSLTVTVLNLMWSTSFLIMQPSYNLTVYDTGPHNLVIVPDSQADP